MSDLVLCKDCEYFMLESPHDKPRCALTRREDPVFGEVAYFYCSTERGFDTAKGCGPSGKNFLPKLKLSAA
jgi:hypothetical protein